MSALGAAWGVTKFGAVGFTGAVIVGVATGATGGVGAIALAGTQATAQGIAGGAAWAGNGLEGLVNS